MYVHKDIKRYIIMNIHNQRILELIKKERVVTTSELASYLKINWNTAENKLLGLALEGKIVKIKKLGYGQICMENHYRPFKKYAQKR